MAGATDIVITGLGALSSVGLDAGQTYASIHAGLNRFADHESYTCIPPDPDRFETEPLTVAPVATMNPESTGEERLLQLLIPVPQELLDTCGLGRRTFAEAGLFLALPTGDPAAGDPAAGDPAAGDPAATTSQAPDPTFAARVSERMGLPGFKVLQTNRVGHAGVFSLVEEARNMLRSGVLSVALVAGVDSNLSEDRLACLDERRRVRSERNVDGFIPGEGAAAVLLELAGNVAEERPAYAAVSGIGAGSEANAFLSDKNSSGAGLTDAVAGALRDAEDVPVTWVLCDVNGESYRAFDWGMVQMRLAENLAAAEEWTHPADCLGDTGAASGAFLLVYAAQAFRASHQPGPHALLWTASENDRRCALCLSPAPQNN